MKVFARASPYAYRSYLLVIVLSVYIFWLRPSTHRPQHENLNPQNVTRSESETATETNYIIRFKQYKPAKNHRIYLESKVRSGGWGWIERINPASKYPTDFGVLWIRESGKEDVVGEIERLEMVKDVNVEFKYQRVLLGESFLDGNKRPGKIFTPMSFEEGTGSSAMADTSNTTLNWSRHLLSQKTQVTSLFGADVLWKKGYTGAKVKMAIFDTGIRSDHPHFRNIKERTNWTNEDTLNDNLGHGTFVAGVIAGQNPECLGFASDTELYAFRVFTDSQVSYTSWFLDAFNYAIATNMDVLNLSIGGPDYLDLPFVEKVWEITASNIIMVSAIGNDGPLYGTLNNPADQSDVIGVGGIDYDDHIASFSSRGMSTWEIPHGYGRVKPDVVAYGRDIMGSKISTGCKSLSGTSVASPVVAGIVCLLVSVIPEARRKDLLNPASMKQALVEGAAKLLGPNMYEQGAGRVDLLESYEILKSYHPRASIFPSILDYNDCPYSWPFCRQPLYAGAMPVIFNTTILNGMGVIGYIESPPTWHPANEEGNLLSIHFKYPDIIWPWTGYLALHMQIKEEGAQFAGEIEGNVTLKIYSPASPGESGPRRSTCSLQLKLKVIPTPPRAKRILWDQFHSIKYPPGYIPRDSLDVRNDILDWHGDHLHTNFHIMYNMLRDAGYYIETLGSPLTCFDAQQYGTLLMVDLEDDYFPEEIEKLRDDVINAGLGLVVFAEWYNVDTMVKMRFFDDNTRSWWTPVTGGANIPALNNLLAAFGIAFGDKILNGDFSIDGEQSRYASGTNIVRFPAGGFLHTFPLLDSSESGATQNLLQTGSLKEDPAVLGLLEIGEGRVGVYGDSNCLDSSHMVTNCYWLLKKMLDFSSSNIKDPVLFSKFVKRYSPVTVDDKQLPSRRTDVNFSTYSSVIGKELICESDSRYEVWGTKGYNLHVGGRNRRLPGYRGIDLGRGLNSTVENTRPTRWRPAKEGGELNSHRSKYLGGLFNKDEIDVPFLVATRWIVPAGVAASGVLVLLSIWRIRQRRRRRRRASGSNRLA
ncbi:PREDICTED: subtilisin-like protease SBT6.1 isoform X2 [Camelina sativa]|uniref:Subtilisin-like protease SBT6.1 isoform X1 n=1 Tax=Camelina sativa TaxID=90675 RepID=A0ABM0T4J0_CAMSA|nr:PREDICTED: subtilisin-like protease SBT6.1 isoform X1 [Camelina sativa]XP_010420779.1 PREDICTED: subtilisin-like protease SBT6.1 isoform X2 [Camelina sativa]